MPWETLLTLPTAVVRRYGRFVVADVKEPCLVLSTSARNGGQVGDVRHIVNHQSCGAGHAASGASSPIAGRRGIAPACV